MARPRHAQGLPPRTPVPRSAERRHLSELAAALASYGVWARIIEEEAPYLRVSNPDSEYAVEDVSCERRDHHYAFLASFGVKLGGSDSISMAARQTAWLVGATTG